jgi:glutathione S-transferase
MENCVHQRHQRMLPTLRLHGYWRSSCAYRVRIVLAHKQLTYDSVAVDILKGEQFLPAYGKINPLRQVWSVCSRCRSRVVDTVPWLLPQVPVLELIYPENRCIFVQQSSAICELVEEMWPERPLMPRDPIVRAQVRAICAAVNSGIQPFQNASTLKWVKKTAAVGETRSKEFDHAIDVCSIGFPSVWTNGCATTGVGCPPR